MRRGNDRAIFARLIDCGHFPIAIATLAVHLCVYPEIAAEEHGP
jgi:hypothetical protein